MRCKICNDSKHVFVKDENIWIECKCLEKSRLRLLLTKTNIPEAYKNITWDWYIDKFPQNKKFKKLYDALLDGILNNKIDKWIALCGKEATGKLGFVSLLVKELCKRDLTASVQTLPRLITFAFNDRDHLDNIINQDFLCVRLGIGIRHNMNPVILEEIMDTRRRKLKYTMFTLRNGRKWISKFYNSSSVNTKFDNLVKFVKM